MATKKISARPFTFAGILVGAFVPVIFAIAAMQDGYWEFNVDTLSDLGISSDKLAANLFNYTCIVAGVLVALFGIGKAYLKAGADCASGVMLMLAGILLAFIGICTKDYAAHIPIALTFFLFAGISVIISGISDWRHGRTATTAITIVTFTVIIASIPGFTIAGTEVISVVAICIWLLGQSISLAFSKD